jgi:hypothetical protein
LGRRSAGPPDLEMQLGILDHGLIWYFGHFDPSTPLCLA